MELIYLDESGYTFNWIKDVESQPFYVLSAVSIPVNSYPKSIDELKAALELAGYPHAHELGKNFEIKAKEIARGEGAWGANEGLRNSVRDLMLKYPSQNQGAAIVSVVNKKALVGQYSKPDNPYELALKYLCERLQRYLVNKNTKGLIVYDRNKREEVGFLDQMSSLVKKGSFIKYDMFDPRTDKFYQIDRILEFFLSDSKHSIGIQVADFFATMTYHYHKTGSPPDCGWWRTLKGSLYQSGTNLYGYKIFPKTVLRNASRAETDF